MAGKYLKSAKEGRFPEILTESVEKDSSIMPVPW